MRIGICFFILCIAVFSKVTSTDLCALDEYNACRDYASAHECESTVYCKTEIWSKPANNNTRICQFCLDDVGNLQKFISAKSTKEFVKNDLMLMCELCPFSTGKDKCEQLINDKFDEIYQDIVDQLDPNVICQGLYLCHSNDFHSAAVEVMKNTMRKDLGPLFPQQPANNDICQKERKCSNLSIAKKCGVVDKCAKFVWSSPSNDNNGLCDTCKAEFQKLHDWIANNATRDEVKKDLLRFCDAIPFSALQQECHNTVDLDFDTIYDLIVTVSDPDTICNAIGLCRSSYRKMLDEKTCDLDSDNACFDYSTAVKCKTLNYCQAEEWVKPLQKADMCTLCKNDIENLEKFLDSNSTREFVEAELLAVCKLIPRKQIQYECQTVVLEYFEEIYNDIVSLLDANMICRALAICRNSLEKRSFSEITLEQQQTTSLSTETRYMCSNLDAMNACRDYSTAKTCDRLAPCKEQVWGGKTSNNGAICDFCKSEISKLQKYVENGTTKADVEKTLHKICGSIQFTAFREECNKLVEENFDTIYDDIIALLDPNIICTGLKLCSAAIHDKIVQGVMERLPGMLQMQQETTTLTTETRYMCSNLDTMNACRDYSTAKMCDRLASCKDSVWSRKTVNGDAICDFCKSEVDRLQKYVGSPVTKDEVKTTLHKVCDTIRFSAFKEECNNLVNDNFDTIYGDIVFLLDADMICTALKLCKVTAQEEIVQGMMEQLPGMLQKAMKEHRLPIAAPFDPDLPCGLNTAEACHDFSTAIACNKLESCKSEVWNKPTQNGALCDMCEEDITSLEKMFNGTREDVRQQLNAFCNKIQFQLLRNACLAEVANNLDEIYDCIAQMMNPKAVCAAFGACCAFGDSKCLAATTQVQDSCTDCESFMRNFQNSVLSNKEVLNYYIGMLKHTKKPKNEDFIWDEYVDMVFYGAIMSHKTNGDTIAKPVCRAMEMCDVLHAKTVNDLCADCKTFFSEWQQELKDNPDIIDKIVTSVSQYYCLQKPEPVREQCARYVEMVIKVMLQQIENEDVGKICSKLQLCDEPQQVPDLRKFAQKLSKIVLDSLPQLKQRVGGDMCTDCHNFMTDIQNEIAENSTIVTELVGLVETECKSFGGELGDLCAVYVKDHYQEVLQQFNSYDVNTICTTIRMCGSKIEKLGGDICTDCIAFTNDWKTIIAKNESYLNDDLAQLKESICGGVPFFLKGECDKIFDEEADKVIAAIQATSANDICTDLYFCDKKKDPEPKVIEALMIQPAVITPARENVEVPIPVLCGICKEVMSFVDKHIPFNSTEQDIVRLLDEACTHLPHRATQCRAFVDKYVAKIVDLILKVGLNPTLVCDALQVCTQVPFVCDICKDIFKYVDGLIDFDSTEEEIIDALDKACEHLPKYGQKCEDFVNNYGKRIVDLILKYATSPSLVCKALMICSAPPPPKPKNVEIPFACELCKEVIQYVDGLINFNSTEQEILDALDSACEHLPKYGQQCVDFVNKYGKEIVDLILKFEANPRVICYELGVCILQKKTEVEGLPGCEVCKAIMRYVDAMIDYNATEAQMLQALENGCEKMPKYSKECRYIMERYGPYIVKLILYRDTNPRHVCREILLCWPMEQNTVDLQQKDVKGEAECDMCLALFTEADRVLSNNATQEKIINTLSKVCSHLGKYSDQCMTFVNEYVPTILNVVVTQLTPSDICSMITLCPKTKQTLIPKIQPDNGLLCDVCTKMAQRLDDMLKDNATQAEIENALLRVCSFLPGDFGAQCDQLIHNNWQKIIDFLVKEMAPDQICVQLKVCAQEKIQRIPDNGPLCDVCRKVAQKLDDMLKDNATEAEIENALRRVCSYLPGDYEEQCDQLVDKYWPEIVNFLVQEMAPDKICSQIRVCAQDKVGGSMSPCQVCQYLSGAIDDFLKENSTQAFFEAAIREFCSVLPSAYSDECNSLVSQYWSTIIDIMVEEMDPKVFCSDIKVCPVKEVKKVPAPSNDNCEVCQLVAEALEIVLKDNATEQEIVYAMHRICSYLPQSYAQECNEFVDNYFDEIVQMLVQQLDPKVICTELGVCSTLKLQKKLQILNGFVCNTCKMVAGKLRVMLADNQTQAAIENALQEVCFLLPDDKKDSCKLIIATNYQRFMTVLLKELVPEVICGDLNFCPKSENVKTAPNGFVCDTCKMIAGKLHDLLADNRTQAAIENALETVCYLVPKDKRSDCQMIISQNYEKFMTVLLKELKPEVICSDIYLCPKSEQLKMDLGDGACDLCKEVAGVLEKILSDDRTQAAIEHALDMVCFFMPKDMKADCKEMISDNYNAIMTALLNELQPDVICRDIRLCTNSKPLETAPNGFICDTCKMIAGKLHDLLANNRTQAAIENALDIVCYLVPQDKRSDCESIISLNYNHYMAVLLKELQPEVICSDIYLCPKSEEVNEPPNGRVCDICKNIAEKLHDLLANNSTQEAIANALEKVCFFVPQAERDMCKTIVSDNYHEFMKVLLAELDAGLICSDIYICSKSLEVVNQKEASGGECEICKIVMDEVKGMINEKSTEAEVLNAVNRVCYVVPQQYRATCHQYINDYGPGVIAILVDDFDPDKVCTKLHMCDSVKQAEEFKLPPMKMYLNKDDELCAVCKQVITYLDEFLQDNYTEDAVEKILRQGCQSLPEMLVKECDALVDEYAPMIFQYIDQIGDPAFVCQHIKLCPTDLKSSQLLGGDKCTYGPSYWCRDMETAKACNALEHCQNHVW